MPVEYDEDVTLGKDSLAEIVLESFVAGAQGTLRTLVAFEALDPLYLFLSLDFFGQFLPLTALFSQRFCVYLAFGLDRLDYRIEFHLFVVLEGPIDSVNGKQLIASFSIVARIKSSLTVIKTFPLMPDYIEEVVMILGCVLPLLVAEVFLEVVPQVRFLLSACGRSHIVVLMIVISRRNSTLVCHAIFARPCPKMPMVVPLRGQPPSRHECISVFACGCALALHSVRGELKSFTHDPDSGPGPLLRVNI